MSAALRRGACPALSAPMPTGDGLLIRLSPVSGGLSPKSLIGLCESAARHGNGVVEVTARGSLQFRGFSASSAERFAADVDALGIAVRTGVPVEVSPLAGTDPADIADPVPIAERIRRAIAEAGLAGRLGPKVSVLVDGGGSVSLDSIAADVRLTAEVRDGGVVWQVAIAGDAETAIPAGPFGEDAAVGYALQVLQSIAALGRDGRARDLPVGGRLDHWRPFAPPSVLPDISPPGGEIRSVDLATPPSLATSEIKAAGAISPLVGEMSGRTEGGAKGRDLIEASSPPPSLPKRTVPLTVRLKSDRHTFPVTLPFGHIDAAPLIDLARHAEALGIADIRPAPARTLLPICPSLDSADALRAAAVRLGFVTDPADPRSRIAACPGAPACASGKIPAREIAERLAGALADLTDSDLSIHISGCEKGCARQAAADIVIVGGENGAGLVVQGTPKATPLAYRSADGLPRAIAAVARILTNLGAERAGGAKPVPEAIRSGRRPGDSDIAALTQDDKARLAAAFEQGRP
ncbi:precorrin-3B synthase [Kumtagia ephedrae]|uniref:Precorrin-3B synthase n=1 Tax=Kumtagia ephedrae TaxID=2116701 RepID=A0A2P7S095_9HYPH|nr:precorrin-3B synthase [Mesorhizobium ephedrae]PSJ55876.1 precorrin-3B synthase [Mesorhizobium ephedrae]